MGMPRVLQAKAEAGADFVEAQGPAQGLGGADVVAGDHDHADALAVEFLDCGGAGFLDRIGNAENGLRPVAVRDPDDGLGVVLETLGFC